jgi:hypothetical protein
VADTIKNAAIIAAFLFLADKCGDFLDHDASLVPNDRNVFIIS